MRRGLRPAGRRIALILSAVAAVSVWLPFTGADPAGAVAPPANTPITHLVVIFQENVSFDHSPATYPNATNATGQPFTGTPPNGAPVGLGGPVNNLANTVGTTGPGSTLLDHNPNSSNPNRFDPALDSNVLTCSVNHSYKPEQAAF